MARNAIQFQKGLSEVAFQQDYGTEAQCEAVLESMRWPDGIVCPEYEGTKAHRLRARAVHQCAS